MLQRKDIAGAVLWACCAQFFVVEAIAASAFRDYSYERNYISDLGAVGCYSHSAPHAGTSLATATSLCSPLHALMDASFIVQGLLIAGGAFLLHRFIARDRLGTAGMALIALAGLGVFIVGLAPEDVHIVPHLLGAAANIVGGNAGMIAVGVALRRIPELRRVGGFAIAAGVVGLLGGQLLTSRNFLGIGIGGMERVAIYPLPLWLSLSGIGILASTIRARGSISA